MSGRTSIRESFPAERVVPFILDYLEEYQQKVGVEPGVKETKYDSHASGGYRNMERFYFANAIEVLAAEAGIPRDTLDRYVKGWGKRKWMHFDLVDRLFVAMGRVDLLHNQLGDLYWNIPIKDTSTCERHNCTNPPVSIKDRGSRWCSLRCYREYDRIRQQKKLAA